MPEVRTRLQETGAQAPGARTFEAQLDDGSWLHISERRTKDGGYVSVGTDITRIKEHEQKLVDNDLRLRATVIDLKRSQTALERQAVELADLAEKYSAGKDPRRGSQPDQVEIPRQYEPRAAHAAERHHRLLRDHGQRHVRHARLGKIPGILPRHPDQRPLPARGHQRHPRHVEDRGRPHEARHGAARSVADARGIAARGRPAAPRTRTWCSTPISKAPFRWWPIAAPSSRSSSICCRTRSSSRPTAAR